MGGGGELISSTLITHINFTVFQNQVGSQIDQYLVCGEDYKTIRDVVAKAILEGTIKEIDRACKVLKAS